MLIPYPLIAAEFNPNFLISDEEMQYKDAMSVKDIASFLKEKGGYIADIMTPDWEGVPRTTAEIIFNAAQEYIINPKYLLVKLQKEQSLVTDTDPTQKQLDWATGYGVCDSCSMDDPKIQKYRGLGKQIDHAAGIMRWYYDNAAEQTWIKAPNQVYNIDGQSVVPANQATAFLYTYTPHIQGNQNFWKLWQNWFDQVYPDGTLMRSADSPEIYVLDDGKRRQFKNMTSLITRYNPDTVVTVPASELSRYPLGRDISLPNYSIIKNGNDYYLIDYDFKRKFASYDVVRQLGYNPDEIIEVTSTDLADYDTGPEITAHTAKAPAGRIIHIAENDSYYYMKDGIAHAIYDKRIIPANFPNISIERLSVKDISNQFSQGDPVAVRDGTLIGVDGDNKIYVVEHGKKRHIASADVFTGLGYQWSNVIWINFAASMLIPDGEPLYLREGSGDVDVSDNTNTTPVTQTQNPLEKYMVRTPANETSYVGPTYETNIESYAVVDYNTGEMLAGKNIHASRPIASLTKVASGFQLLTEGFDPYQVITYDPAIHKSSYHSFRIAEGEQYYAKDLLYAMLVTSLNTPVRMLVNRNNNDELAFVSRLNTLMASRGFTDTHFDDISGLSDDTVSTAREYAELYRQFTKEQATLRGFLGTTYYEYNEVLDMDSKPHHFDYHNNKLTRRDLVSYDILSSKTGFTYAAGPSLVMHVQRKSDKKEFVIVSLGLDEYDSIRKRYDGFDAITEWAMKTL